MLPGSGRGETLSSRRSRVRVRLDRVSPYQKQSSLRDVVNLDHGDTSSGLAPQDRGVARRTYRPRDRRLQVVARRNTGGFYLAPLRRILLVIICFQGVAV